MVAEHISHGSLFSTDFLRESIARGSDWQRLTDAEIDRLAADLRAIFDRFPTAQTPNESQTEDDLIWPILARLGWTATLRQQNLAARGREDVPDGLLFQDAATKAEANAFREEWKRYGFGVAIVESKRWQRPLDRQSGRRGEETAPSTQMLRYLRRVEDLTTGKLRWGILTNGARWRLYYQGARSVSEQFFELDLAAVLAIAGHDGGLFSVSEEDRRHWLRIFALVFRRDAFQPTPSDPRTFHQRAIDEGRFYEERVAENLSNLVFGTVFPELAKSIAIEAQCVTAACPGAGVFLLAKYEEVDASFSALGRRGKPAEAVADEAVAALREHHASGTAVEPHLADQLLLPLALAAGASAFTAAGPTGHLLTNSWTIGQFGVADVAIEPGAQCRVRVEPRTWR